MFVSAAYAQTAGAAPAGGGMEGLLVQLPFFIGLGLLFWFLIIRPQQRRIKQHQQMVASIKRGDGVVLSSGVIGKVVRVEDSEVQIEIAPNTNVRVVKTMVAEVRTRGEPAPANDPRG